MSKPKSKAKKPIIIFGTGVLAKAVWAYFTNDSYYQVVAFCADKKFVQHDEFLELPLVPFEKIEHLYPPKQYGMFVALSYRNVNRVREAKYSEAKAKGYTLVNYVSSKAIFVPQLNIGDNCFLADSTIQAFAQIGNNVMIWSGNVIGHDSVIGDHCFISSNVSISGNVIVEPNCFFGVNSCTRDGIRIARSSVIGAGAAILKSTVAFGMYAAKPAELFSFESTRKEYLVRQPETS